MLRRDNKIQFAIEQVINHPILAEFNGLSCHTVILVTKANQLVKNNRWVGIVDTDDDFRERREALWISLSMAERR